MELTPVHIMNNQTAKQTILEMTVEVHGRRKVISSQKMKPIGEQIPLVLLKEICLW